MKRVRGIPGWGQWHGLPLAAVLACLLVAIPAPAQNPPGDTSARLAQAPAATGRGRYGGGRGAFGATTGLGDGPWDYDTSLGPIRVTVVTHRLNHPWSMAFVPGGDVLVTERRGRLRIVREGVLDPEPIGGLPAIEPGVTGGLLDIALHPAFESNRLLYFSYSKPRNDDPSTTTLAVARARWDGGAALDEVEDLWIADAWHGAFNAVERCCGQGPAEMNYGGRLAFDSDGYLFIASGDRNWGEMAQITTSHLGKIIRLRDDGSAPEDNPFIARPGYLPDLYSIGHRNPSGLVFHPLTGGLWSSEFGPEGGDELNLITPGGNYGWILATRGEHYDGSATAPGSRPADGMIDPVISWSPSINPGNLVFYDGEAFPAWRGHLLMATLSRSLLRAEIDASGSVMAAERMLEGLAQRIRDVRVGPDGLVYLLTDETAGSMLRIEPRD